MDEGRIVAWHKREGDRVKAGEILFEVETDKATMEVEAPAAGVVRKILSGEGATVPVASTIALITDTADEPVADLPASPEGGPAEAEGALPEPADAAEPAQPPAGARSSPAARMRAKELGVDINSVAPSSGVRVTIADVEAAAAAARGRSSADGDRRIPLTRMRRAIGEAMARSATIPQFQVSRDVDMRSADTERKRVGVSYSDMLIAASAHALAKHERFRSRLDADALLISPNVSIGIAVTVDDGLVVPVIHGAHRKRLIDISTEREQLEAGARSGRLPASALSGATFSISNLGTLGVDRFTALVNPPEVAILAVGRVSEQTILTLTLSVDHRVADGADGARFLSEIVAWLERPVDQ